MATQIPNRIKKTENPMASNAFLARIVIISLAVLTLGLSIAWVGFFLIK